MKFGYILFSLSILLQSSAQVLEKKGLGQLGMINGFGQYFNISTITRLIINPYIIAGVIMSVAGLFMWLGAMSQFKLSYLYAIGSLSYIVVALLSLFILGESIAWKQWLGVAVIISGCVLMSRGQVA
jgi:drug/metabolite transporter (DMT)-like permease